MVDLCDFIGKAEMNSLCSPSVASHFITSLLMCGLISMCTKATPPPPLIV